MRSGSAGQRLQEEPRKISVPRLLPGIIVAARLTMARGWILLRRVGASRRALLRMNDGRRNPGLDVRRRRRRDAAVAGVVMPVVLLIVIVLAGMTIATAVVIGIHAGHDDVTRVRAVDVSVRVRPRRALGVVERVVATWITVGIERGAPVTVVAGWVRRIRRAITIAAPAVGRQLITTLARTAGGRGEHRSDGQAFEQVSIHFVATRQQAVHILMRSAFGSYSGLAETTHGYTLPLTSTSHFPDVK